MIVIGLTQDCGVRLPSICNRQQPNFTSHRLSVTLESEGETAAFRPYGDEIITLQKAARIGIRVGTGGKFP